MQELKGPNIPIVCAIIERINIQGEKEILIQTRWKPGISEYSGCIEVQAGWIEKYENVYDALKREIKEETGLNIINIKPDINTGIISNQNDGAFAFKSFCCIQQIKGGLPWIGFVFICEVENGFLQHQESENKDLRWIKIKDLSELVRNNPKEIFTLEVGALELYLQENNL